MPPLLTPSATTMLLDDGTATHTRRANEGDFPLIEDFQARCSPTSRSQRYGTHRAGLTSELWGQLVQRPCGRVLPHDAESRAVAMTRLAQVPGEPDVCDLARLIADRPPDNYQGRGLGTRLADHAAWRVWRIVERLGGPRCPTPAICGPWRCSAHCHRPWTPTARSTSASRRKEYAMSPTVPPTPHVRAAAARRPCTRGAAPAPELAVSAGAR
ncbi:hypothetical protein AB0M58_13440 [Streptomyces bobili]|uniref:hypothetical protein n=1 Tax=Streptomyces bobili TaxID=67280 RepID=UPI0034217A78